MGRRERAESSSSASSASSASSDDETAASAGAGVKLFSRARKRPLSPRKAQHEPAATKDDDAVSVASAESAEDDRESAGASASANELEEGCSFQDLGLSPWLVSSCANLGLNEPTLIQRQCVPPTLAGQNIIGSAPTGSGKTAAFALPVLDSLAKDMFGVFAIAVTPTRELAFQIADQFLALGTPIRLKCEVIVGGTSIVEQQIALSRRPHVIVGTPGRLADHLSGAAPPAVKNVQFLILDEADRLLDASFAEHLGVIFKSTPPSRQTLLYSATMTTALERAKKASKKKVFEFHTTPNATTPSALDERYLLTPKHVKPVYLAYVLRRLGPEMTSGPLAPNANLGKRKRRRLLRNANDDAESGEEENQAAAKSAEAHEDTPRPLNNPERAKLVIIFASSCKNCQIVGEALTLLGFRCSVLHSGLTQPRRLAALGKFRSRMTEVLVATDVASRGLDIPQVDLVINYDVPHAVEDYIHRVGRTARAGRAGLAITFVSQFDLKLVLAVEKTTGTKMELLPDVDEERDVLVLLTRVTNALKSARMRLAREDSDSLKPRGRRYDRVEV